MGQASNLSHPPEGLCLALATGNLLGGFGFGGDLEGVRGGRTLGFTFFSFPASVSFLGAFFSASDDVGLLRLRSLLLRDLYERRLLRLLLDDLCLEDRRRSLSFSGLEPLECFPSSSWPSTSTRPSLEVPELGARSSFALTQLLSTFSSGLGSLTTALPDLGVALPSATVCCFSASASRSSSSSTMLVQILKF